MVTITELTTDDDQLLELFMLLDQRDQGLLMRHAAVAACHAAACRQAMRHDHGISLIDTPETVTRKALWRCAPALPCGWRSDTDFEFQVENAVKARLDDRALDMILTTTAHDERNAQVLADWAGQFADLYGPDYCAPRFEDGYVDPVAMRGFIEDWRESFISELRRSASFQES